MGEKVFMIIIALLFTGVVGLIWWYMVRDKDIDEKRVPEIYQGRNYHIAVGTVAALTIFSALVAVGLIVELFLT